MAKEKTTKTKKRTTGSCPYRMTCYVSETTMGKEFDTRWVTIPILAILALTIGDANPWTVALAVTSGFGFYLKQ